ncbi:MAG: hypothetical protein P8X64_02415 [Anaerolineales bacterium]|jgi:hypothetical protein
MGQFGFILLLLIAFGISIAMLFVGMYVFFRSFLQGVERAGTNNPGRAFLTGLINTIFLIALGMLFVSWGQSTGFAILGGIGALFWILLLVGIVFGLSGMVLLARTRLYGEAAGWRPVANSGGILFLACATPYIGWFGFLPYLVLRGLGAVMLHMYEFYRVRRSTDPELSATG